MAVAGVSCSASVVLQDRGKTPASSRCRFVAAPESSPTHLFARICFYNDTTTPRRILSPT